MVVEMVFCMVVEMIVLRRDRFSDNLSRLMVVVAENTKSQSHNEGSKGHHKHCFPPGEILDIGYTEMRGFKRVVMIVSMHLKLIFTGSLKPFFASPQASKQVDQKS